MTIDRVGFGQRVVEVYPIAALRVWLRYSQLGTAALSTRPAGNGTDERKSYKTKNAACAELVTAIRSEATWLDLGAYEMRLNESQDCIDALVCALVAKLAVDPDYRTQVERQIGADPCEIEREGWIHLPPVDARLDDLHAQADP